MSRVSETLEGLDGKTCFFCGRETERGGFWAGYGGPLIVCYWCVPKLGLVAADAVADQRNRVPATQRLRDLEREYWRGLVLASEREAQR